ncbi:DNA-binding transcriptional MerR regulator [Haloactinospora alba]|uniref:DNA-binding transcriptional MerR regulator n=1 Tax=Haloactinospora alba TaxID=405555 RepID=A0A543NKL5_9ACTN|nr:MerR family transcriptional regulator [Haloactinospora alba]TQN32388.1 DNA-binding transcriptional MerR regulator [Haloactinospora alba]
MRIGELSQRTGASPRSLRYYESLGIISSERRENGYRDYSADTVRVVHNVRSLLAAGLAMSEIQEVGECLYTEDLSEADVCDHVLELYQRRLSSVEANIASLTDTRERLTAELDSLRERQHGAAEGDG